jgi:hypothetical protein
MDSKPPEKDEEKILPVDLQRDLTSHSTLGTPTTPISYLVFEILDQGDIISKEDIR